jgi:hypothetical protein
MKNWNQTRRKTEYSWASALAWELILPPESRNKKRIERLRKRVKGL